MKSRFSFFIKTILNSYAILFFSQNSTLGGILLLVSFINLLAGMSGLCCVVFTAVLIKTSGYQREHIQTGIYSFNNLLLGLAFGTFYQFNMYYVIWLIFTALLLLMITVVLAERLGKLGLPILSIPFILCFWILLLSADSLFKIGLVSKSSVVMQEVYGATANLSYLHNYLSFNLPGLLCLFFRSLSAMLFQDNIIAGACIAIGLLVHSRIAFSLAVLGFLVAYGCNAGMHIYPDGISYYHLGANFMMATIAIGSFFTIPSMRSYLWAIACIPVVFILINAFSVILAAYNLPIFSLPFCVISFTLLYFLLLRKDATHLQLVKLQHYSPERNLYQFINQQNRLNNLQYFRLRLPFMGSWTVSQGYDGNITHINDWGKALDFVIEDEDKKTFKFPGALPEHFYSFNKPVLSCGDGVVANVVDNVEDNAIGVENLLENWGNTVVIKHLDGLYSKVSHLKKQSIKVKIGDTVKQGDLIGLCGNSGRSPEPHLHFQLQITPYIDAKTLSYPFAYYVNKKNEQERIASFMIPKQGDVVNPVAIVNSTAKAFDFQLGYTATLVGEPGVNEQLEVFRDEFGQTYFYSITSGATAYFINDGTQFYFTSFYGSHQSLLFLFYLAAYKITFTDNDHVVVHDVFPLHLLNNKPLLWLQDFVSPFFRFISLRYSAVNSPSKSGAIQSTQVKQLFGKQKILMEATISLVNDNIQGYYISVNGNHKNIEWVKSNTY
jgi:urea transporter